MSQDENVFIQVRARLRLLDVKLWLAPYHDAENGPVDAKMNEVAAEFGENLGIAASQCKLALLQLQDRALKNMASRKEYDDTGIARFTVRRVANESGTVNTIDVKCSLQALGSELLKLIADSFEIGDTNQVKCIAAGKILEPSKSLSAQGLKNNQQLMIIISQIDQSQSDSKEAMYDRIRKIKMDIEAIVDSQQQLFEMEDQDGKPVFLPPEENRSLLIAMGFCEKARAAMKREHYDEALILLLEADDKFTTCNSKFLESVDNYALVNLDIVWCYLCLKNVTELPDAERRLEICATSFRRSYGEDMCRLVALKGNTCPERALLMRLHLMEGVLLFHRNQRKEAHQKLEVAASELRELKVDDESVDILVEMGYEPMEARLGLRAASGNIEQAVNFIHERREKLRQSRSRSAAERNINKKLKQENRDKNWVNPRSVCTLMEMGFDRDVVVAALKLTKNDLKRALDLLQTQQEELRKNLPPPQSADATLLDQLKQIGFAEDMARVALETTHNSMDKAIDFLVNMLGNEDELLKTIGLNGANVPEASADTPYDGPSTSHGPNSIVALQERIMQRAQTQMQSLEAYNRFHEDIASNEDDYLDLPLVQEETILKEYKRMLEQ